MTAAQKYKPYEATYDHIENRVIDLGTGFTVKQLPDSKPKRPRRNAVVLYSGFTHEFDKAVVSQNNRHEWRVVSAGTQGKHSFYCSHCKTSRNRLSNNLRAGVCPAR